MSDHYYAFHTEDGIAQRRGWFWCYEGGHWTCPCEERRAQDRERRTSEADRKRAELTEKATS